jgi:hypothetical protein
MKFRTLALALVLSCGFTSTAALAAKRPYKPKIVKPKKDKRYKNSQAAKVKPRKAKKHRV